MVNNAIGTCYEDAWRFLIKEGEGELVHGTVESLGKRIGHAWVELPTSYIWEPQTQGYFSIKDFDIVANPIEEHRYTIEEAAIMLTRVGKHGPWTEQEKSKWIRGGNPMAIANPAIEERLAEEIAKFLVAKRQPIIKAAEIETISKELGYGERELREFSSYFLTPEGKDFFKKSIRLELWKAGYRPYEL